MNTVYIVEDEFWVLQAIVQTFDFSRYDFKLVGTNTKSVDALIEIEKLMPDLVITDIRMPKISGLDLVRQLKDKCPFTHFVIISGYSDFDYAKQAIQYGVNEYILKPISTNDADILLDKMKMLIEDDKKNRQIKEMFKLITLSGEDDDDSIKNALSGVVDCGEPMYFVAFIKTRDSISNAFNKKNVLYMGKQGEKYLFVFQTQAEIKTVLDVEQLLNIHCTYVSASNMAEKISDINILLRNAHIADMQGFINSADFVLYHAPRKEYLINFYESIKPILVSDKAYTREALDFFVGKLKDSRVSIEEVAILWNYIAFENKELFSFLNYDQIKQTFLTLENMCEYILKQLNPQADNDIENGNCKDLFRQILLYIEDNYNKEISLKELSKQFNISMPYLSSLFKKEVGINYCEYLTQLRMTRSASLLGNINLTIEEICCLVGYNDYYYFNKVFKKHFNVSPGRYRKERLIQSD